MSMSVARVDFDRLSRRSLSLIKVLVVEATPVAEGKISVGQTGVCRCKIRILVDCFLKVREGVFKADKVCRIPLRGGTYKGQLSRKGIYPMVSVTNFQPSKSGFHFVNSFAEVPDIHISAPIIGDLGIGNASNGLCGGMVFAVRDYFESKVAVAPDVVSPLAGPLFDYIVMRLFDSFNLDHPATGLARYMELMNPALSDDSRATVMITQEWPKVKANIDNGHLSPLALIETKSLNSGDLGQNHQVLVYGYDLSGTKLVLHLYDPNAPGNDGVTLSLDLGTPQHATPVKLSSPGAGPIYCFFQPIYVYESVAAGFANAQKWKSNLSAAVKIGTFLITGVLVGCWIWRSAFSQVKSPYWVGTI